MNLLTEFRKIDMLSKIRIDRPNHTIHKVLKIEKNKYGFYNVHIDMEGKFFDIKVKHTINMIPYPLSKYNELNIREQEDWFLK